MTGVQTCALPIFSLVNSFSFLLIIWLILYKLVMKTSLSFLYILKWKAIVLIMVIFTAGGLHNNRGV